ncbi:hypothetical protein KUTeg_006669 [Tegillarca granosa]|uniref:Ribosome production factor 2 homolog n=1 Tax=Tegillarca granosa TaxID=220873 RepID=A0ABQ9FAZ3_TEGGR|nr:hypothetical protein KUTeg_006669 [Tegillarca granosa]
MVLQRIVKPKTQKGKRFLEKREPKITENTKTALFLKGGNTSITVSQGLKELNILRPFEDETPLEFFSKKSDASLFMFGSHSKKRPDNLVLGRMFDFHVSDMIELGIQNFKSMLEFSGAKCAVGTKPCILFAGEPFDQELEYKRLKNLFIGPVVEQIRLAGMEHVIMITAQDGKIYLRNYKILLKKSGSRTPRVELEEMGPSLDLVIRRTKLASDDLYKQSLKVPKAAKIKKKKNISRDPFGSKLGRIHMQKQDLGKLQTRKVKALKVSKKDKANVTTGSVKRKNSDRSNENSKRSKTS